MMEGLKVTPLDIQQKRFHVGFRGYEKTEVEMFLDLVRDEMESLLREMTDLREFRQSYDQRLNELNEKEEMIKNTLIMTQKLMEEQKDNARKEAALIIRDAEIRSQQIIGSAQEQKVRLANLRARRDAARTAGLKSNLEAAARSTVNLMPLLVECAENDLTLGEICGILRRVWGEYQPPSY